MFQNNSAETTDNTYISSNSYNTVLSLNLQIFIPGYNFVLPEREGFSEFKAEQREQTMEKSPASATLHSKPVLQEPCGLLLILTIISWFVSRIQSLSSLAHASLIRRCWHQLSPTKKSSRKRNKYQDDGMELAHEDITTVMRNIGLNFDQQSSIACEFIGSDHIPALFDDDEPSLHEVKQAFLVFDENKDGYLDASDLQRIFQSLGLREGVGLGECEQMIAKYDMNMDRRIDLVEFTKVLEATIC